MDFDILNMHGLLFFSIAIFVFLFFKYISQFIFSPFNFRIISSDLTFDALHDKHNSCFFYIPESDWLELRRSEASDILNNINLEGHIKPFLYEKYHKNHDLVFVFNSNEDLVRLEKVITDKIASAKKRNNEIEKNLILARINK